MLVFSRSPRHMRLVAQVEAWSPSVFTPECKPKLEPKLAPYLVLRRSVKANLEKLQNRIISLTIL